MSLQSTIKKTKRVVNLIYSIATDEIKLSIRQRFLCEFRRK